MFRNVFIGVDGTSHGRDAIALATVLAAPGARLTLAHVQPGATPLEPADQDLYGGDPTYYSPGRGESLELLEAERAATGVDAELVTVPGPKVGPALHSLAEEERADLLVVGACKHRLAGRILIGDDTRGSVNGATCPVAIAPAGYAATGGPPSTIGVGSTEESRAALTAARDLAARHGSKIIPLDVDGQPAAGGPPPAVAGSPDHVDLLVIDSPAHGPLRRLMFTGTSLRLARHGHSPMIVIPRGLADGGEAAAGEDDQDRSAPTAPS